MILAKAAKAINFKATNADQLRNARQTANGRSSRPAPPPTYRLFLISVVCSCAQLGTAVRFPVYGTSGAQLSAFQKPVACYTFLVFWLGFQVHDLEAQFEQFKSEQPM
jgi:hypothetical protein